MYHLLVQLSTKFQPQFICKVQEDVIKTEELSEASSMSTLSAS